jgi:hypothetical protein
MTTASQFLGKNCKISYDNRRTQLLRKGVPYSVGEDLS